MSKVYLEDSTLTNIGNAIRAKTGGVDLLLPSEMPNAIASISGGGGVVPSDYSIPMLPSAQNLLGSDKLEYKCVKVTIGGDGLDVTTIDFDNADDFLNRCVYLKFATRIYYSSSNSTMNYPIILPWLRNDLANLGVTLESRENIKARGLCDTTQYSNYSTNYTTNIGPGINDSYTDTVKALQETISSSFTSSSFERQLPATFTVWNLSNEGFIDLSCYNAYSGKYMRSFDIYSGSYPLIVMSLPRKEG